VSADAAVGRSRMIRLTSTAGTAAAAGLMLSSLVLPWTERGVGASVQGHRFATLMLERSARGGSYVIAGLAVLGAPAAGALLLVLSGIGGPAAARLRLGLAVVLAFVAAVVVVTTRDVVPAWGVGGKAVGLGGLIALVAAVVDTVWLPRKGGLQ
jgi:hypothetical protein